MEITKPFVAYGRGYSGSYDTLDEAKAVVDTNRQGNVYVLLKPIDMILHCPLCGFQHIDALEPENDWDNPPHKSHLCHRCETVWRPADVPTNGVADINTRGDADTWPEV